MLAPPRSREAQADRTLYCITGIVNLLDLDDPYGPLTPQWESRQGWEAI